MSGSYTGRALAVDGWMSPSELAWLRDQASGHSVVVEVGSWKGRSSVALAEGCRGCLYMVDHFNGASAEENIKTYKDLVRPYGRESVRRTLLTHMRPHMDAGRAVLVEMASTDAAEYLRPLFQYRPPDMVFIDADHEYDGCAADIRAWSAYTPKLLCGHDRTHAGVRKALDELVPDWQEGPDTIWFTSATPYGGEGQINGFHCYRPVLSTRKSVQVRPVTLNAVIGTWNEADVIGACVKNCFANGCSNVFAVDNASSDGTRECAVTAGAVIADVYETPFYQEEKRLASINRVVSDVTKRESGLETWWLVLDADEFPCGPSGERLVDYLGTLDGEINTVGALGIDLYPERSPGYVEGAHPACCMSRGMIRSCPKGTFCSGTHWKHSLIKTAASMDLCFSRGFHVPYCRPRFDGSRFPASRPLEPANHIWLFHAPFREKEATGRRLELLCNAGQGVRRSSEDDSHTGNNGALKRWKSFDAVYNGRWQDVDYPHSQRFGRDITGVTLYEWRRLVPFATFPQWVGACANQL
jgi:hypothetical protein